VAAATFAATATPCTRKLPEPRPVDCRGGPLSQDRPCLPTPHDRQRPPDSWRQTGLTPRRRRSPRRGTRPWPRHTGRSPRWWSAA